jgi:hypothetical protein
LQKRKFVAITKIFAKTTKFREHFLFCENFRENIVYYSKKILPKFLRKFTRQPYYRCCTFSIISATFSQNAVSEIFRKKNMIMCYHQCCGQLLSSLYKVPYCKYFYKYILYAMVPEIYFNKLCQNCVNFALKDKNINVSFFLSRSRSIFHRHAVENEV